MINNGGLSIAVNNHNQQGARLTTPMLGIRTDRAASIRQSKSARDAQARLALAQLELELYVDNWAVKYVGPALAGDVDAAFSLSVAVSNAKRGEVVVAFWKAKAPVPAFAKLLESVWSHDHSYVIGAAQSRRRLRSMFRYAEYKIPEELPASIRVWRGVAGITSNQARKGVSWTTDRDTACWFAARFANDRRPPLVLSAVVDKDSILFYSDERCEREVLLFDAVNAIVDGDINDWQERFEIKSAEMKAERDKMMKKTRLASVAEQQISNNRSDAVMARIEDDETRKIYDFLGINYLP